jgi:hypothetical protein
MVPCRGVELSALATKRASCGELLEFLRELPTQDECILWPYGKDTGGYGIVKYMGKYQSAHRASFYMYNGCSPRVVRHTCDTPACVNPKHLLAGSYSDNLTDMYARGRDKHFTKLTDADVEYIINANVPGKKGNTRELAIQFNVSVGYIRGLSRGAVCRSTVV